MGLTCLFWHTFQRACSVLIFRSQGCWRCYFENSEWCLLCGSLLCVRHSGMCGKAYQDQDHAPGPGTCLHLPVSFYKRHALPRCSSERRTHLFVQFFPMPGDSDLLWELHASELSVMVTPLGEVIVNSTKESALKKWVKLNFFFFIKNILLMQQVGASKCCSCMTFCEKREGCINALK